MAFKNGKVFDYFQKRHTKFDDASLEEFVSNIGEINPFKKAVKVPAFNLQECCLIVRLTGIDLYGKGEGLYYLQSNPRFGHPHYKNFDNGLQMFFEKNEFNVGKPLSTEKNRIEKGS